MGSSHSSSATATVSQPTSSAPSTNRIKTKRTASLSLLTNGEHIQDSKDGESSNTIDDFDSEDCTPIESGGGKASLQMAFPRSVSSSRYRGDDGDQLTANSQLETSQQQRRQGEQRTIMLEHRRRTGEGEDTETTYTESNLMSETSSSRRRRTSNFDCDETDEEDDNLNVFEDDIPLSPRQQNLDANRNGRNATGFPSSFASSLSSSLFTSTSQSSLSYLTGNQSMQQAVVRRHAQHNTGADTTTSVAAISSSLAAVEQEGILMDSPVNVVEDVWPLHGIENSTLDGFGRGVGDGSVGYGWKLEGQGKGTEHESGHGSFFTGSNGISRMNSERATTTVTSILFRQHQSHGGSAEASVDSGANYQDSADLLGGKNLQNGLQYHHRRISSSSRKAVIKNHCGSSNVAHSLFARESMGGSGIAVGRRREGRRETSASLLKRMGGSTLYNKLDKPSGGIPSETEQLRDALECEDWSTCSAVISRLAPRLIGEYPYPGGTGDGGGGSTDEEGNGTANDSNNATAWNGGSHAANINGESRFSSLDGGDPALAHAVQWRGGGGGRSGYERDAFVLSGGVALLLRIFYEPSFVQLEKKTTDAIPSVVSRSRSTSIRTYCDARELTEEFVSTKLGNCWNEALTILREMVFHLPNEVLEEVVLSPLHPHHMMHLDSMESINCINGSEQNSIRGEFLPWLFSLLTHDTCFDAAAALIEEILSLQSQAGATPSPYSQEGDFGASSAAVAVAAESTSHDFSDGTAAMGGGSIQTSQAPAAATETFSSFSTAVTTFTLSYVPDIYELWGNFNCRQLAHFCRILALLVFEPEDRHLLMVESSPTMLKSIELLQLRRDRLARSGGLLPNASSPTSQRESSCKGGSNTAAYVDENQSIVLGDESLIYKLVQLLQVMNYSPDLNRTSSYHVMAHFPWIADTLIMMGLNEMDDWDDISRLDSLARKKTKNVGADGEGSGSNGRRRCSAWNDFAHDDEKSENDDNEVASVAMHPGRLGTVADMLESLAGSLLNIMPASTHATHLGHIIHVINAAQAAGVVMNRQQQQHQQLQQQEGDHVMSNVGSATANSGSNRAQNSNGRRHPPSEQQLQQQGLNEGGSLNLSDRLLFLRGSEGSEESVGVANRGGLPSSSTPIAHDHNHVLGWSHGVSAARFDDNTIMPHPSSSSPATVQHSNNNSMRTSRYRIINADDAANELQFNALLLAPYQVEVLFVLCTLLGARRKMDAQTLLCNMGLVEILNEMFDRLSWGSTATATPTPTSSNLSNDSNANSESTTNGSSEVLSQQNHQQQQQEAQEQQQQGGIHGPGCECNPESALRVQYLRLIHNFCDRDCDNYHGRRLMLSSSERDSVFCSSGVNESEKGSSRKHAEIGLLSKIIAAFVNETEESPYKFWLASCAESYLRGSTSQEQYFVATSNGLLPHLLYDNILQDKFHCAGSLQTSFDLLGEICKGSSSVASTSTGCSNVLELLMRHIHSEDDFKRLMMLAVGNLVDSNVFLRALLLSVERLNQQRQEQCLQQQYLQQQYFQYQQREQSLLRTTPPIMSTNDIMGRTSSNSSSISGNSAYLTHSWWDVHSHGPALPAVQGNNRNSINLETVQLQNHYQQNQAIDNEGESEWFLPFSFQHKRQQLQEEEMITAETVLSAGDEPHKQPNNFHDEEHAISHMEQRDFVLGLSSSGGRGVKTTGWQFSPAPPSHSHYHNDSMMSLSATLTVSSSNNIHLSTEVYEPNTIERLSWFLQTNQSLLLRNLLGVVNLQNINHENICCLNTAIVITIFAYRRNQLHHVVQDLRRMKLQDSSCIITSLSSSSSNVDTFDWPLLDDGVKDITVRGTATADHKNSAHKKSSHHDSLEDEEEEVDCDVVVNFRELLWFWSEYYNHRGRDRLSLEFSSHLKFHEWEHVVKLLCNDDGTPTSLLRRPISSLPQSPYQRAPRSITLGW